MSEKSFVDAVSGTPIDRDVAGVYADWLDDHSRPYEASVWRAVHMRPHVIYRDTGSGENLYQSVRAGMLAYPVVRSMPPTVWMARIAAASSATGQDVDAFNLDGLTLPADSGAAFRDRVLALCVAFNTGDPARDTLAEMVRRYPAFVQHQMDGNATFRGNMERMDLTPESEARKFATRLEQFVSRYVGKQVRLRPRM